MTSIPETRTRVPLVKTQTDRLVLALEAVAFLMLERENHLYLAGRFEKTRTLAEWRRHVRLVAEIRLHVDDGGGRASSARG